MGADSLTHAYGEGCVAVRYGLEEAVFLSSIMFWWKTNRGENRNYRDGRWWTYNSLATYQDMFPWWSAKQIRRVIASCKEKGALLEGCYNEDQRDRTKWYSPSDELLELYGEARVLSGNASAAGSGALVQPLPDYAPGPSAETPPIAREGVPSPGDIPGPDGGEKDNCICPNGQMQLSERTDTFAPMGKCIEEYSNNITCTYSGVTSVVNDPPLPPRGQAEDREDKPLCTGRTVSRPKHHPEWFEQFWQIYPNRKSRQDACRAWDKLKPDAAFCRMMFVAIQVQKRSEEWQKEGGRYIPHFSRWLNGHKWEDEVRFAAPPEDSGGWAPDPEVTD